MSTRHASTRWTRPRGDDGAMAVFVSIVMVFVLLPASALGVTSYTRSAVQAELVRTTDSAALAGAASLVLLDVAALPEDPFDAQSTDGLAFAAASRACTKAGNADDQVSDDYATVLSCTAGFSPDPALSSCLTGVVDLLDATLPLNLTDIDTGPILDGGLGDPLGLGGGGLGGTPVDDGGLVDDLLADGLQVDLNETVTTLTPALLHNGIKVTLRYQVRAPLDGLLGADDSVRTAVSTARRRFKPLLPPDFSIASLVVDPEEFMLYTTLGTTLGVLETVVGEGLTELPVPLPPPVVDPVSALPSGCRTALLEIIQDLRDALQKNTTEQDLLACLGSYVLGIDAFAPLATSPDCVNRVFRAQLAPNA